MKRVGKGWVGGHVTPQWWPQLSDRSSSPTEAHKLFCNLPASVSSGPFCPDPGIDWLWGCTHEPRPPNFKALRDCVQRATQPLARPGDVRLRWPWNSDRRRRGGGKGGRGASRGRGRGTGIQRRLQKPSGALRCASGPPLRAGVVPCLVAVPFCFQLFGP